MLVRGPGEARGSKSGGSAGELAVLDVLPSSTIAEATLNDPYYAVQGVESLVGGAWSLQSDSGMKLRFGSFQPEVAPECCNFNG